MHQGRRLQRLSRFLLRQPLRRQAAQLVVHQGQELAGDRTNWWAPDDACVRAMLRSAGLRVIDAPAHETYVCERDCGDDPAWALRRAELNAALWRRAPNGVRRRPLGPYSSQRK